jgi:cell wall-associated NlpC family hydrolase
MADITGEDGKKLASEAAGWKGTKYALIGEKSQKGSSGDCSGTTYKIYSAAGFKYEYRNTQFLRHSQNCFDF